MRLSFLLAATAVLLPVVAHAADPAPGAEAAGDARFATASAAPKGDGVPDQLDGEQRAAYRAVFASIRGSRWADAQLQLDAMKPGPLHAIARAELFTAKGSPKAALEPLLALLAEAPELPQAPQIARLAKTRGAVDLPLLPTEQRLIWNDGAPNRLRAATIKSDAAAAELATQMAPFIKDDRGAEAEALVQQLHAGQSQLEEAQEQQRRIGRLLKDGVVRGTLLGAVLTQSPT